MNRIKKKIKKGIRTVPFKNKIKERLFHKKIATEVTNENSIDIKDVKYQTRNVFGFEKDGINLKNENNNKNDNINNNKNIKHLIYNKTIADLKKNKITKQKVTKSLSTNKSKLTKQKNYKKETTKDNNAYNQKNNCKNKKKKNGSQNIDNNRKINNFDNKRNNKNRNIIENENYTNNIENKNDNNNYDNIDNRNQNNNNFAIRNKNNNNNYDNIGNKNQNNNDNINIKNKNDNSNNLNIENKNDNNNDFNSENKNYNINNDIIENKNENNNNVNYNNYINNIDNKNDININNNINNNNHDNKKNITINNTDFDNHNNNHHIENKRYQTIENTKTILNGDNRTNKRLFFPKKNQTIKVSSPSATKSKNQSKDKLRIVDRHKYVSKSKDTISTNVETISTINTLTIEKKEENELEKYKEGKKVVFTPIPSLLKKSEKNEKEEQVNLKDVEKAIQLRRQEYNEYLKQLNKPKPKRKPKPKVYNLNNVIFIQKMYKGYHVNEVNHTITRLRINYCVTELLCLIFNNVFKHARKRITFYMFKTYYHDPFTNIFNEVNFSDKLAMKLSGTYYNINNFGKSK